MEDKEIHQAEILGKAMRLGSMISVQNPDLMCQLKYYPKKKVLEMRIPAHSVPLYGEVAEARFKSLANTLNVTPLTKVLR